MAEKPGECLVITTPVTQTNNDVIKSNDVTVKNSPEDERAPSWRYIGDYEEVRRVRCRRVYCKRGSRHDLALFYDRTADSFHALGAWCGHMGGPLFEGDIEDYKGSCHVMCPWHAYMFDLKTGKCDIGLEQSTFIVRVDGGKVFILHSSCLSLHPYL